MLPVDGTITTWFNTHVDYIAGRTTHEAIDIVTDGSQPIKNLMDGYVSKVIDIYGETPVEGFGNEVWITHENGLVSRFCHCTKGIPVKQNQAVKEGQIIAYTGRTGYRSPAYIYHTHWEVYKGGVRIDPLSINWDNEPNKKRMNITKTQRAVYVQSAPNSKTFDIYVIIKHEKEPYETRHAVKNSKGLVATVFGMNEAWEKVEWAQIKGLTEGDPYDINNVAITKPGSFKME